MSDNINERVAKMEVKMEHHDEKFDRHERILMNLHEDIKELGDKIDNSVDKALDTVPAWFAKWVVTIATIVTCAALGLHHFHVI